MCLPFPVAIQCLQSVFGIDIDDPSQMEVVSAQPNLKVWMFHTFSDICVLHVFLYIQYDYRFLKDCLQSVEEDGFYEEVKDTLLHTPHPLHHNHIA